MTKSSLIALALHTITKAFDILWCPHSCGLLASLHEADAIEDEKPGVTSLCYTLVSFELPTGMWAPQWPNEFLYCGTLV